MTRDAVTEATICEIIGRAIGIDVALVFPSTDLRRDLALDSIGLMSIVYLLEELVGIDAFAYAQDFIAAESASDIIDIVQRSLANNDQ